MTTRKTGGLLRAISPCYRPASKGAGFHFVQATCLCHLCHPLKGCSDYFLTPWRGPDTLSHSICLAQCHASPALECIFLSSPRWGQPYWHNTLLPKNDDFQICTLNLHAYQTSLMHFCPWGSPWNLKCWFLVVCSPKCVYDPASYALQWFQHLCIYIAAELFLSSCLGIDYRSSFVYTLGWTQCDIYTSILFGLSYLLCWPWKSPFLSLWSGLNTYIIAERWFFCITFDAHPHSGWFIVSHALRAQQAKAHNKKPSNLLG